MKIEAQGHRPGVVSWPARAHLPRSARPRDVLWGYPLHRRAGRARCPPSPPRERTGNRVPSRPTTPRPPPSAARTPRARPGTSPRGGLARHPRGPCRSRRACRKSRRRADRGVGVASEDRDRIDGRAGPAGCAAARRRTGTPSARLSHSRCEVFELEVVEQVHAHRLHARARGSGSRPPPSRWVPRRCCRQTRGRRPCARSGTCRLSVSPAFARLVFQGPQSVCRRA